MPRFASLVRAVEESTTNALWIQWQALGGQAAASRAPHSIVDPEALVLASIWLAELEPRLLDFLYGFAESGSRLLSVQRMKRAAAYFPDDGVHGLAGFAMTVSSFGSDPRWRRLSESGRPIAARPGKVVSAARALGEPGSLMLRLRTGFGVDVRTDVLTFLIGSDGAWADVREMSEALLYAKYSVRRACEGLGDARLIESSPSRPVRYYADPSRWMALLELSYIARWYPWMGVYSFLVRLLDWFRTFGGEPSSDSLAASRAREFMLGHAHALVPLQLALPDERDFVGGTYLAAFHETVSASLTWLDGAV